MEHLELRSVEVLSDKSMCIIARSCPNNQYLDLQFCYITDRAEEEITLSCHKLKHLDLYGVVHISDSSISKIAKMCPSIVISCSRNRRVLHTPYLTVIMTDPSV